LRYKNFFYQIVL